MPVTNELLISTRSAYSRYKAYLEKVKQEEEEQRKKREKADTAKCEQVKRDKLEAKLQKEKKTNLAKVDGELAKINTKEAEKHGFQKTAQLLLKEAEEKLSAGIKNRDMDQISVAHAMLETAGQRLAVANSDIDDLKKQKQELERKKRKLDSKVDKDSTSKR